MEETATPAAPRKRGTRADVVTGRAERTSGGKTKDELVGTRKIKSKRRVELGKEQYKTHAEKPLTAWRRALRIHGVSGKAPSKGSDPYKAIRKTYHYLLVQAAGGTEEEIMHAFATRCALDDLGLSKPPIKEEEPSAHRKFQMAVRKHTRAGKPRLEQEGS